MSLRGHACCSIFWVERMLFCIKRHRKGAVNRERWRLILLMYYSLLTISLIQLITYTYKKKLEKCAWTAVHTMVHLVRCNIACLTLNYWDKWMVVLLNYKYLSFSVNNYFLPLRDTKCEHPWSKLAHPCLGVQTRRIHVTQPGVRLNRKLM